MTEEINDGQIPLLGDGLLSGEDGTPGQEFEQPPNTNYLEGIRCPKCGSREPFQIECPSFHEVYDDITEYVGVGAEWHDESAISCTKCNHEGVVADFTHE